MSRHSFIGCAFAGLVLVVCGATAAIAQEGAPPAAGPLMLEPMGSAFVLAPEVKVTKVGGDVGTLAGVSGGWIKDERLLIGAALYTQAAGEDDDRDLTYGGLVIGWFFDPGRPVSVSARMLLGVGRLSEVLTIDRDDRPYCLLPERYLCSPPGRFGGRFGYATPFRVRDDFLVAEPEIAVVGRVNDWLRLAAGAGYRLTTRDPRFAPNARGATGTVSFQFNF